MPWLRGNLHAHTTFSDGVKDPAHLIAEYEALGYDFLAITDHENWIDDSYWRALPKLSSRLLLFHGVELNWPRFEQHIGRVVGDRERNRRHDLEARHDLARASTPTLEGRHRDVAHVAGIAEPQHDAVRDLAGELEQSIGGTKALLT